MVQLTIPLMTMPATVPGTQLLGGLYVGGAAQEMSPAHTSWKTWKSWKGFAMAGDRYLSYYKAIWDSFEDGSDPVQNVLAVANAELASQRHTMGEEWAKEHAEAARLREELAARPSRNDVLREAANWLAEVGEHDAAYLLRTVDVPTSAEQVGSGLAREADAQWICKARAWVPALLAELERLRGELAENTGVMQVLRRQRDEAEQENTRLREERDDYYDAIQRVLEWCATTAHVSAAASVLEALEG